MSPFKKTFLMILSLMFVFCLFACGPEEESEYSLSMRNASESGAFGEGTKLAVFDVNKDRYIEKYFGAENRASVPEEVGAIVRITSTGSDCTFVLIDGRDGTELANRSFSSSDMRDTIKSPYAANDVSVAEARILTLWNDILKERTYREHYESGKPLPGNKVIFYDPEADSFENNELMDYIEKDMRASLRGEGGVFVMIHDEGKEKGDTVRVTLFRGKGEHGMIAEHIFLEGLGAGGHNYNPQRTGPWITSEANKYFAGRDYALALETEAEGGGNKLIGYDQNAEVYTARFIPEDLIAVSPSETALVAGFKTEMKRSTEKYSLFGFGVVNSEVTLDLESISVELIEPKTERVLARTSFSAEPPKDLKGGTKYWVGYVDSWKLESWFRTELEKYLSRK
ncbi:MAG: hypothetical protein IKD62_02505 [Oscillospiraceae bacterium]|nr:hypothetical protein [Oscillospiraceae bacterium]